MSKRLSDEELRNQNDHRRRAWEKQAPTYDKQIGWFERHVFGEDNRAWACSRAHGDVLEVAVGSGLNLPKYAEGVRLIGVDLSPAMLEIAKERAAEHNVQVDIREADAHDLPFEDGSFDSVVCTFSLCNIPDVQRAVGEMKRVLRPGGRLILVDHVRSANWIVLGVQKLIELVSIRMDGDHMTRRPLKQVEDHGFEVTERDRFRLGGIVERLVALRRP